jgi:predicted RNase H-like HicB family nuclease
VALKGRKTIGTEPLKAHIKYCVCSGFVKDERPLSTLIIANPERGKSTEVMKFPASGSIVVNDLTSYGLGEIIEIMIEKERRLFHHLIIPDLERISARSRKSRAELLANLQIAMQEGITRVQTYNTKINLNPPIQLGVVMCTTPDDLGDRRSVFRRLGFLSRLIPFSFDFSAEQKVQIMDFVKEDKHLEMETFPIKNKKKVKVFIPETMKDKLKLYAKIMALRIEHFSNTSKENKQKLIGIRALENIICYLKAIALSNNRNAVTEDDFDEFLRLYRYFNFRMCSLEQE